MKQTLTAITELNDALEHALKLEEPDWDACAELVDQRDQVLATIELTVIGLKAEVERSIALNQQLTQGMQKAQQQIEQSLVQVNKGKKARASYE
ncbi:hypothetical protein [Aliidiomarina maris]|uniref:Flagellar protein FliT n=1 Tax=Aliidiomarina maris TaxID=531312 RepID=A0A327X6K8_9GAMM|nr:hypothetical protein [Aliidiomarina maris]MBA3988918.1 hypothetical protein [Idiomarina sp.]RAK00743.1 hypothetical protein B0I24_102168 [Aliidiomarina maris]RUO27257.1 hypothetical protein CWE07_04735 [Aliidiomarina maris]